LFSDSVRARFGSGKLVYTFVKNFYNVHMDDALYAEFQLTREGSCAYGACFIAWVLNYVDGDNVRASKLEFWSRLRAQQLAEGSQRALTLRSFADLCEIQSRPGDAPLRYAKITFSNPFTNTRLQPHLRSLVFPLTANSDWSIHRSEIVVLYLQLVHEITFSIPMNAASARNELRGDNSAAIGLGSHADELITKSPVFTGSLLSYATLPPHFDGTSEHMHTVAAMQDQLAGVTELNDRYFAEVIKPLLYFVQEENAKLHDSAAHAAASDMMET